MTLPRNLKTGARGRDVRVMQRALRKAGFRPKERKLTNVFDAGMDAEVRRFQEARGLGADGEIGPETFAALAPHVDRYGELLLARVLAEASEPTGVRQRIVAAAEIGHRNRDAIRYTQSQAERMQGVRRQIRLPDFPKAEDCSSFATWCYWVASAPDPNGRDYDGHGFTGTQVANGSAVQEPRPGDLVFYGREAGGWPKHVAVYVGNGRVVSHGSESGPHLLALDYRGDRTQIRSYLP